MSILIGLIVLIVIIAAYVISVFNFFQSTRVRIEASIQEIGNQLKRQANLIPNLTESAKAYMKHESGIYKQLTDARKAVEVAQAKGGEAIDTAVQHIQGLLPKLQILVEDNPELKANGVVEKLMNELRDTADKLMYSRRTLIDLTADFNQKLMTFPSNLIANVFGVKKEKGLATPESGAHMEVSEAETKDVKVEL